VICKEGYHPAVGHERDCIRYAPRQTVAIDVEVFEIPEVGTDVFRDRSTDAIPSDVKVQKICELHVPGNRTR